MAVVEPSTPSASTLKAGAAATAPPGGPRRRPRGGIHGRQGIAGWSFVTPAIALLVLFLLAPILMALWVSLTNWAGRGSPFTGNAEFVGLENYRQLFLEDGLVRRDFMTSLRNNIYYVALVVPVQTALALFLAMVLNQELRARGFFRTAFYFPSVTSSVAISLVFLFLFTGTGAVNAILDAVGIDGPVWFSDARGVLHLVLGGIGVVDPQSPPEWLTTTSVGGLSLWEWLAGPSVALMAIIVLVVWTTTGTFMLMFLAALQDVSREVEEAATIDGANRWQRFRYVVLPAIKPAVFLVLTLGLIGTWQVFDQIYVMSQGAPAKTTLTPAFLSYQYSFRQNAWGLGAAMAFVLFAIITLLTTFQRFLMRDKDAIRERRLERAARRRRTRLAATGPTGGTR